MTICGFGVVEMEDGFLGSTLDLLSNEILFMLFIYWLNEM